MFNQLRLPNLESGTIATLQNSVLFLNLCISSESDCQTDSTHNTLLRYTGTTGTTGGDQSSNPRPWWSPGVAEDSIQDSLFCISFQLYVLLVFIIFCTNGYFSFLIILLLNHGPGFLFLCEALFLWSYICTHIKKEIGPSWTHSCIMSLTNYDT